MKELPMKKMFLSMALLGSICQESKAITSNQIIGACEVLMSAAGACSVYIIYKDLVLKTPEATKKIWADQLRKELQNQFGMTMTYEDKVVAVADLTDEQILVITGKDKLLSYLPVAKNAMMVLFTTVSACYAVKWIGRFNQ